MLSELSLLRNNIFDILDTYIFVVWIYTCEYFINLHGLLLIIPIFL